MDFGEAVQLRHLNERKSDYLKILVNLKAKCFRSNFNQKRQKVCCKLLNTGKNFSSQNRNITRKTELFGQHSLPNYFNSLTKKRN